jgi:hypothetical protein
LYAQAANARLGGGPGGAGRGSRPVVGTTGVVAFFLRWIAGPSGSNNLVTASCKLVLAGEPATRAYLRLFALGRRFEPDREGRRFEPDREADRRVRRAGRFFAGTFLLGSGLTAGP